VRPNIQKCIGRYIVGLTCGANELGDRRKIDKKVNISLRSGECPMEIPRTGDLWPHYIYDLIMAELRQKAVIDYCRAMYDPSEWSIARGQPLYNTFDTCGVGDIECGNFNIGATRAYCSDDWLGFLRNGA
jgi:hypothetical protein